MAPRHRATRQPVSYQESASEMEDEEDEDSFESSDGASPPPPPSRPRRKTQSTSVARTTSAASRTRRQPRKVYAEDSTDEEDGSDFDSDDDEIGNERDKGVAVEQRRTTRAPAPRGRGRPPKKAAPTASPRKGPRRQVLPKSSPPPTVPRLRKGITQFVYTATQSMLTLIAYRTSENEGTITS